MGDNNTHWKRLGWIPPQGGPQSDGTATLEGDLLEVGVSPAGGGDGGG